MDAYKAISYVHNNGTNLEIARLRHILYGEVPEASKSLQALLDWPISDWEDSQIAWALDCLHKGGIERNHALVEKLLVR